MTLVDANILLYAVDELSPHHEASAEWLVGALNRPERMGLPWQTIGAFLRIATHPRIMASPLSSGEAMRYVEGWTARPNVWIPPVSDRTLRILGELVIAYRITGNLIPDGMLAAVAIENGLSVTSADSDFARFTEVRWINPLRT